MQTATTTPLRRDRRRSSRSDRAAGSAAQNAAVLSWSITFFVIICAARGASALDESWKNLGHTIRESNYTVATRDGRCVTGRVGSFDQDSLTIGFSRLDREDVIRVGDGSSVDDHDPIYSGRSSWSDLQHAAPNQYERIRLDLKNGGSRTCHAFSATGDQAACDGTQVEKAEVSRGYYVRLAPATDWEHHAMRENVPLLAPRTWFNFAFFPRISVLLYDAASAEENAKIECRTEPVTSPASGRCISPTDPKLAKVCAPDPQSR